MRYFITKCACMTARGVRLLDSFSTCISGESLCVHLTSVRDHRCLCCSSFLCSFCLPGMTDLLAPLLAALDDEADAFWCFTRLVEGSAFFKPAQNHISVERQLVSVTKER